MIDRFQSESYLSEIDSSVIRKSFTVTDSDDNDNDYDYTDPVNDVNLERGRHRSVRQGLSN